MNKLIVTIALMALSQASLGEEKNTLEKAQEVVQQMRDDADKEYAKGVAKRNELRQWSDAAEAVKRIQARHDQHEGIRHKAQVAYDRFKSAYGWCWGNMSCYDHDAAAGHWQTLRDATHPNIAIAKADIKTGGTTMNTELARTKKHLEWAKREKVSANNMEHVVKTQYGSDEYIDEAERTSSTAYAEVVWAEESAKNARKATNAVSDGTLDKARQAEYDKADTYLSQQRAIHEAEQAEIAAIEREKELEREREQALLDKEQALLDRENEFLQLMTQLLYGT